MSTRRVLALVVSLFVLAGRESEAQVQTPPPPAPAGSALPEFDDGNLTALAAFFENDLIPHIGAEPNRPANQDRNYTYGFAVQASGSFIRKSGIVVPLTWLDTVSGVGRKHAHSGRRYYSLLLFGTGFTPDTLNEPRPIFDDRPYSSIVGLAAKKISVNPKTFDSAWSSELTLGILGLEVIADLQTKIHRNSRRRSGKETPRDPEGWDNQISDGGEPTALYRVSFERRLLGDASGPDVVKHWQVVGGWQGSAGYYTNAALLGSARVGRFTSEFWEFSPGAMGVGNQNLGSGKRRKPRFELFAYGGVRPKLVAYNALLQGQFRDSVHTIAPRRGVIEWEGGVATFIPWIRTQVVYQFALGRTSEYRDTGPSRRHTWGSIFVVYSWPVKQP